MRRSGFLSSISAILLLFAIAQPDYGLVLHPDNEPDLAVWTDRPDANVVGKWISYPSDPNDANDRASCVAVAPTYVITTRHQGGGTGAEVEIGGVVYSIASMIYHPDDPDPEIPENYRVDLRLVKLVDADLDAFVPPNTIDDIEDEIVVIGGFGLGRGADLTTDDIVYGYQWQDRKVYKNNYQRWCTNIVDSNSIYSGNGYNTCIIEADFDGTNIAGVTDYEGIGAEFDSGCGWFIKDGDQWKVAGLTRGVEHFGESWFNEQNRPRRPDADIFNAVQISPYADWILDNIAVEADFNGDYHVNFLDFAQLADDWKNGEADFDDVDFLTERWLNNESP